MKKKITTYILVVMILLWTLIPFYWFLRLAFMTPAEISAYPPHFYPHKPTISGFYNVLGFSYNSPSGETFIPSGAARYIKMGLKNSFILSTVVTIITMVIVTPLSYTFGPLEFQHKNKLFFAILLSVALPPVSILIPFYILFVRLGLAGNLLGLVLVTLIVTIPFVAWMLLGYFRNLPPVERLATIDGFSRLGTFFKIIIPMAKIGIAVGSIVSFLFAWNEYTFALVLVNGTPATTIPASISGFLFQHPEPEHLAASILYSLIPAFIVVYFLQEHITKMNITEPIGG
jgi:multiple sugar transport system permease protein